jgi:hypothetical protein
MSGRLSYDDVAVAVPVTVPYVRHSIRGAHWFLARALAELLKTSGLRKDLIDGLVTYDRGVCSGAAVVGRP